MLPPVLRVQLTLHPWVAFGIMPLFAFWNAGGSFAGPEFAGPEAIRVLLGVVLGLVRGKPLGVFVKSWLLVKLKAGRLPHAMSWKSLGLIAVLAGVGFTMSVSKAMLVFNNPATLSVAKLGVLLASVVARTFGFVWGTVLVKPSLVSGTQLSADAPPMSIEKPKNWSRE